VGKDKGLEARRTESVALQRRKGRRRCVGMLDLQVSWLEDIRTTAFQGGRFVRLAWR